jgi:hypothetical protein
MGKMSVIKFLALFSIAIGSLFQTAGAQVARCINSQNCMAFISNNKCVACYNSTGMKYPKKIQNGACTVGLNTITNCQWFNGTYSGGNIPVDFVSNELFLIHKILIWVWVLENILLGKKNVSII